MFVFLATSRGTLYQSNSQSQRSWCSTTCPIASISWPSLLRFLNLSCLACQRAASSLASVVTVEKKSSFGFWERGSKELVNSRPAASLSYRGAGLRGPAWEEISRRMTLYSMRELVADGDDGMYASSADVCIPYDECMNLAYLDRRKERTSSTSSYILRLHRSHTSFQGLWDAENHDIDVKVVLAQLINSFSKPNAGWSICSLKPLALLLRTEVLRFWTILPCPCCVRQNFGHLLENPKAFERDLRLVGTPISSMRPWIKCSATPIYLPENGARETETFFVS